MSVADNSPSMLCLVINLSPLLHKLRRFHFHSLPLGFLFGQPFLCRKVAHVLADLH